MFTAVVDDVATLSLQWEVNVATLDCRFPNAILRVSPPSRALFGPGGGGGGGGGGAWDMKT